MRQRGIVITRFFQHGPFAEMSLRIVGIKLQRHINMLHGVPLVTGKLHDPCECQVSFGIIRLQCQGQFIRNHGVCITAFLICGNTLFEILLRGHFLRLHQGKYRVVNAGFYRTPQIKMPLCCIPVTRFSIGLCKVVVNLGSAGFNFQCPLIKIDCCLVVLAPECYATQPIKRRRTAWLSYTAGGKLPLGIIESVRCKVRLRQVYSRRQEIGVHSKSYIV